MYYARFGQQLPLVSTVLTRFDPTRVPTRVEQPTARLFPSAVPLGRVELSASDCEMLQKQGLQCGIRMRAQPNRTSAIVHTGIAQGTVIAVLSGEIVDGEGSRWRQSETIEGVRGYAPFVGPNGVPNVARVPGSPPWPGDESRVASRVALPLTPLQRSSGAWRYTPNRTIDLMPRARVQTPPNPSGSSGLIVSSGPAQFTRVIGTLVNGTEIVILGAEEITPRDTILPSHPALRWRLVAMPPSAIRDARDRRRAPGSDLVMGYVVSRYFGVPGWVVNLEPIDDRAWP